MQRFQSAGSAPMPAAGYIHDKGGWCGDRILDCYALVYLLAGGGTCRGPTGEQRVATGDCLVLFPGERHAYGPAAGERWSEAFVVFHGAAFDGLERDGLLDRRRPVLHPGLRPALVEAFDDLIGGFARGLARDPRQLTLALHALLVELVTADAGESGTVDDVITSARARLEERLDHPVDLPRLARSLGLGYEVFRKRFAAATGLPPARYRLHRRIDRAKALLAESHAPLAAVAERLGFCDQFFFARQFKQVTGMNPGAYRRAVRG